MSDELKPLSKKHQRVLDEYLICWSKVKAYQAAYKDTNYNAAKSSAVRLFTDANFLAHFQARLDEVHMSADEALKLTADIARGDVGDFITDFGIVDIDEARKNGKTNLIKRITQKTITDGKTDNETHILDFELYDRQTALRDILKLHGKFTERVDVTSGGEKLQPPSVIEIIKHTKSDEPD